MIIGDQIGGGAARRPEEPGAAFFDLDRTLMEGSSAFQFGRAAYRAGLVNRRVLLRDAYENVLFRLRGSTDAGTDALRERIGELLRGVRVRDLQRLAPDVLAGVLRGWTRRCSTSPTSTRTRVARS